MNPVSYTDPVGNVLTATLESDDSGSYVSVVKDGEELGRFYEPSTYHYDEVELESTSEKDDLYLLTVTVKTKVFAQFKVWEEELENGDYISHVDPYEEPQPVLDPDTKEQRVTVDHGTLTYLSKKVSKKTTPSQPVVAENSGT